MRKEEFLQSLRRALNGDVPPRVIEENIRYYDSYITSEVLKGRTEEEVTAEIGDPRLIARTIEDTTEGAEENGYGTYQDSYSYEDRDRRSEDRRNEEPYGTGSGSFHYIDLNKWYWKLLIAVIIIAVLYVIFAIVGGILSLLAPILIPVLAVWMVISIVRMNGRR